MRRSYLFPQSYSALTASPFGAWFAPGGVAIFPSMRLWACLLFILSLGGCGGIVETASQPPIFCYASLGVPTCYSDPLPGSQGTLLGDQG